MGNLPRGGACLLKGVHIASLDWVYNSGTVPFGLCGVFKEISCKILEL